MNVQTVLGGEGLIARGMGQHEHRPQQMQMAEAVARAIAEEKHLAVEAGTGVGKSFAYLVPAVLAATASKEGRVVISTHTISLQEQLILKDIPFLQKVMPEPFPALLVKGRGNYLSKRRLRVAQQKAPSLLTERLALDQLEAIGEWAEATRDGTRSDLSFRPLSPVWDLVESDTGNCLGKKCADYQQCFYFKAREHLQKSKILVVNHALFFADLALRAMGKDVQILPKYQAVIFDEAHTLEDVAADHLGLSISRGQMDYLLTKLFVEKNMSARGLLATHLDSQAAPQVHRTRFAVNDFFTRIAEWRVRNARKGVGSETLRVNEANIIPNVVSAEFAKLANELDKLAENIENDEEKIEIDWAANRCHDLAERTSTWLEQKLEGQVYWIDGAPSQPHRITLTSAPIEIGPLLKELLFDRVPSVILTSATLSVGGAHGFDPFVERIGFPLDHPKVQLGSPFNYGEQVELHLYRQMPEPKSGTRDFEDASVHKILELVERTRGRAFVLFTSNFAMQWTADRLRGPLRDRDMLLISQGDGQPTAKMLEQFRHHHAPVLFGVDSFWQGVDVQGEALSNVIITKLPFLPPDRPLIEARVEAIKARGGDAFQELQLPQAIIKLKQGFGRLIRTKSDQGIVAILDPRVITKPYGRRFLDALPRCRKFIDGVEVGSR